MCAMTTQGALAAAMLAMALVSTCFADSEPITLASLLQKQHGGSRQATGYSEAHSTRACLQLKNAQNCDIFGLASALYLE